MIQSSDGSGACVLGLKRARQKLEDGNKYSGCLSDKDAKNLTKMSPLASILIIGVTTSATLALTATIASAADDKPSIEELLKTGWQIAGYSQAFDNRSTFILFRNPDQPYLVQCRVGYDVTRTPSAYSLCYKLR
jgi:hypothetical protein